MLSDKELKKIENELSDLGISPSVRQSIRNSKICIIDNQIDDLKSLHDGLKREGFSNLVKFKSAPNINDILNSNYDIIILDLNDVALKITEDDGIGVLKLIKEREPSLPILVVTGKLISPDVQLILSKAELVRKKPVLAADLANDVETILKIYKDKFWSSVFLLKELNKVDIELKKELGFFDRLKLRYYRKSIEKKLIKKDEDILDKLEKVLKLIRHSTSLTSNIYKLISQFLGNA